jgi:hypothetical protein
VFGWRDPRLPRRLLPSTVLVMIGHTGDGASARLLIHAPDDDIGPGWSMDALIQRLRVLRRLRTHAQSLPISLAIRDLEGHRVLSLDEAGTLVDVALSPGIYHVSAEQGVARLSYTVALAPGTTFDLYLRLLR